MRVLPLALWHRGEYGDLVRMAEAQSRVTHGSVESQACCAMWAVFARTCLDAPQESFGDLWRTSRSIVEALSEVCRAFEPPKHVELGAGTAWATVTSALVALREPDYESTVREAIKLGGDTDTTACVAGGIAGIRHGVSDRWLRQLRGREMVEEILGRIQ